MLRLTFPEPCVYHLPMPFRFAFPCFVCYYTVLLYTVNVLFSRLLKHVARFGSAYSVICRDMPSSLPLPLPLPLRFLPFVLPEGILPMRYDAICYNVLRRYYDDSTTIYDDLRRATGFLWEAELPCRLKTTL